MEKPILIKSDTGEFYEKLLSYFNFHLDQKILTTALHNSIIFSWCDLITIVIVHQKQMLQLFQQNITTIKGKNKKENHDFV
jgi:hypothetical protein